MLAFMPSEEKPKPNSAIRVPDRLPWYCLVVVHELAVERVAGEHTGGHRGHGPGG